MQNKIDVGIIGLGSMGMIRKALAEKHPALNLVALSDAHRPNIPRTETYRYYEDYRELLDSGVDAVFVAPQNKYRPRVVIDALNRGKHVFCEIPPGRTLKDMQNIMTAEKKNEGLVLKFGFNHRFHGAVLKAKEIIDAGTYGKILWMKGVHGKSGGKDFESIWRSNPEWAGGGILLDQGIHMIDLFRFFAGDFTEVKSLVSTSFWNISLEDNAFALLRNCQNQVAMVHASSTHWKHTYTFELCLENGYIIVQAPLSLTGSYGPAETLMVVRRQFENESSAVENTQESVTCFDTDTSWEREMDEFADCIRNGTKVQNGTSYDALQAMKLVDKVYRDDTTWYNRWKSTAR
jgi:predicted dehydrogenase